jgi:hypothetical protein
MDHVVALKYEQLHCRYDMHITLLECVIGAPVIMLSVICIIELFSRKD